MEPNKSAEKKPAPATSTTTNVKSPEPEKRGPLKEICIEVCQSCQTHKWCTRHEEKKYNALFEEAKTAIQSAIGGEIQVVKNLNIKKPRIGAFEVNCNGIVLFSKIKCGLFPVPTALAQRVKLFVTDYNSGKDVMKYSSIEEKKYSPPKKKITQTSLDWNAKYEELKKSQLKPKEKQNSQSPGQENEGEKEKDNEKDKEHENENETEKPKDNHNSHEEMPHQDHEEKEKEPEEKKEVPNNDPKNEGTTNKEGGTNHE